MRGLVHKVIYTGKFSSFFATVVLKSAIKNQSVNHTNFTQGRNAQRGSNRATSLLDIGLLNELSRDRLLSAINTGMRRALQNSSLVCAVGSEIAVPVKVVGRNVEYCGGEGAHQM
ncbi:unannotated protein [freshwater metagenome]|uniref:Unannotated protein n=1 Tax=freshwater metagenome TaxID=449393 RepID=A0A6J6BYB7_9ZZZZ